MILYIQVFVQWHFEFLVTWLARNVSNAPTIINSADFLPNMVKILYKYGINSLICYVGRPCPFLVRRSKQLHRHKMPFPSCSRQRRCWSRSQSSLRARLRRSWELLKRRGWKTSESRWMRWRGRKGERFILEYLAKLCYLSREYCGGIFYYKFLLKNGKKIKTI